MDKGGEKETGGVIEKLKNLDAKGKYIVLIIIRSENYASTNQSILRLLLQNENNYGVYITVNQPYETIKNVLENAGGIDTSRLFFIDCVTKTVKGNTLSVERTPQCLYINSPENLTDIAIATDEIVNDIRTKKKEVTHKNVFLFLDSLSTLLMYNSSKTVAQFSHFLSGRMRFLELYGILMSVEEDTDKEVILKISQFCDKVVR